MPKVLVIDDESSILENIQFILELEDYEVLAAESGEVGLEFFLKYSKVIDAVITDMRMPQISGMDILKEIKKIDPEMSVIILTGHGDMENAISAMKEGAFDYLNKPVKADKLLICLENAINKKRLMKENKFLHEDLITKNSYLQGLHDSAQKILLNLAPGDLPEITGYRLASEYKSCDKVGGDMYDIFDIGNHVGFYVFDVCSHGILASVITMILKTFLENLKYQHNAHSLAFQNELFSDFIKELNIELYANTGNNIFATLFIGCINKIDNKLTYISAGHIDQYVTINNKIITLPSTSTMLGLFEEASFELATCSLEKGSKLLLFTDGITEVWHDDKMFGCENILKILSEHENDPIDRILEILTDNIYTYGDSHLDDDMTILGIELV